jgi:MerR family copper efflux transcriptional regulator
MRKADVHQIGEVAERTGLSLRTVRYYEEQGLVRPAKRTDGGFRLYRESEIARLERIKEMKPLGFTIQEMRELLDALDRLAGAKPESRAHQRALTRLGESAKATKERTRELRAALEAADRFSGQLDRELRRHRRKAAVRA